MDPDLIRQEFGIWEYDPKDKPLVMGEIFQRKLNYLNSKKQIILSTPYVSRHSSREKGYHFIKEIGAKINAVLIQCTCSEATAKTRIQKRLPPRNDPKMWDRFNKKLDEISAEELIQNPDFSFLKYDTDKDCIEYLKIVNDVRADLEELATIITKE